MIQWFKNHAAAILATAAVIGNAGVLGKGLSAGLLAIATAFGVTA